MKKTGTYKKRSSTTKDTEKEPHWDEQEGWTHDIVKSHTPKLAYWLIQSIWLCGFSTTNCGKFFKKREYQTTWPASWEICIQVRKQQLELDMEQQTGSK